MDNFSWSDSIRAVFSSCLPCLRDSSPSQTPSTDALHLYRAHPDELEGLLAETADTDTEAETLSLHSNPAERRHPPSANRRGHKSITLFGFNLFGRPPIHLPDDDEEGLNTDNHPRRKRRTPETISSVTLDLDAAPLDPSAIDGLSPAELEQRALAAAEEERRLKDERRRRRQERRELKKAARALAVGGLDDQEFEGFPGSGSGVYPRMPNPFQAPPSAASDSRSGVTPTEDDMENDAADADLDGEHYTRRSTSEGSNGSDSRSRSHTSSQVPIQSLTSVLHSDHPHSPSPTPRRTKKLASSTTTSQSPSLSSPLLSPVSNDANVVLASPPPSRQHERLIPSTGYGFPSTGLSDGAAAFGARAKSRDMGAFLATRGDIVTQLRLSGLRIPLRKFVTMAPPTYSSEDSKLVEELHKVSKAKPKLIKSSVYQAPADPNITVRSWKMNEFKYYDIPSPFPTLARGLFTTELSAADDGDPKYRIVARGYDKFFNINEVPWTSWSSLEARTCAPYILSLKSNGCIIFIAALTPSKLLITSKHSIGPVADSPLSHAQAGEKWLRKYLAIKGKTEEDLASSLWMNNWTAIAELCDDSFEEHVLGYPPEKTGLHLHGLNESTKAFKTLPQTDVDAFAEEWGFIKTSSLTMDNIPDLKTFTDEIGKTGKWNGEAVEGFVVRTHVVDPPSSPAGGHQADARSKSSDASPYAAGSTFFFKIKFDEPYMMYRDWREITKSLLSKGQAKISATRMKRPETRLYVKWVTEQIKKDREPFMEYTKGKGIISTREEFLKWLESDVGRGALADTKKDPKGHHQGPNAMHFGKTIIVPVAAPGCGKTAISVALAHIFGFGHTQSDDVRAKKPGPIFLKNVLDLLKKRDVVIADKNNHLESHRRALRDATSKMYPPVRLFALYWSCDYPPLSTIHGICSDRVVNRGGNHQTLCADDQRSHEDVIWKFLKSRESLADNEVDAWVNMKVEESLERALERAIEGCVEVIGVERPTAEKVAEALEVAKRHTINPKKKAERGDGKQGAPRYFALLPEMDLHEAMWSQFECKKDMPMQRRAFWDSLAKNGRVQNRPHVTVVHQKSLPGERELWERCERLNRLSTPPLFKMTLGSAVWNERVLAVTVDTLEVQSVSPDSEQETYQFISALPRRVRDRLHITVGTRDSQVQPVEAKALVESWKAGTARDDVQAMVLDLGEVWGRLKGLVS